MPVPATECRKCTTTRASQEVREAYTSEGGSGKASNPLTKRACCLWEHSLSAAQLAELEGRLRQRTDLGGAAGKAGEQSRSRERALDDDQDPGRISFEVESSDDPDDGEDEDGEDEEWDEEDEQPEKDAGSSGKGAQNKQDAVDDSADQTSFYQYCNDGLGAWCYLHTRLFLNDGTSDTELVTGRSLFGGESIATGILGHTNGMHVGVLSPGTYTAKVLGRSDKVVDFKPTDSQFGQGLFVVVL